VDSLCSQSLLSISDFQYLSISHSLNVRNVLRTLDTSTTCWKLLNIDAWSVIRSVGDELGALIVSVCDTKEGRNVPIDQYERV
jgi:hypothetical protein